MASIRKLKTRIKTTKNISKITRAMEMVAASKMKKAQDAAVAGRLYTDELTKILNRLSSNIKEVTHPLLSQGNPDGKTLIVIFSTDKGLCGGLNTNLFLRVEKAKLSEKSLTLITVGRKAKDHYSSRGYEIEASFLDWGDSPTSENLHPVTRMVTEGFAEGRYSEIWIAYPKFITTLTQETQIIKLLPLGGDGLETTPEAPYVKNTNKDATSRVNGKQNTGDYLFEPNADEVLDQLLPYYFENKMYQILLDSKASEQSARMVAMKNAHDNAKDLGSGLNLTYNRLRQARVTNELLDAIGSRMALG